jgi:hypothetical protein
VDSLARKDFLSISNLPESGFFALFAGKCFSACRMCGGYPVEYRQK